MSLSAARGIPRTVEACIAVVNEGLAHRLGEGVLPPEIETIVSTEVERLWANPIKTYIPVLVTRAAWDAWDALSSTRGSHPGVPMMNAPTATARRDPDTLMIDHADTLSPDERQHRRSI